MSDHACPICNTQLEVTDVAPCMECGIDPHEIEHAIARRHTYAEMRIPGGFTLVLCGFCRVGFGSFIPAFFGLPKDALAQYKSMQLLREIEDIYIRRDEYCPRCGYRLPFLKFIQEVREMNEKPGS